VSRPDSFTGDEAEPFPALLIHTERPGSGGKADLTEMVEQTVHGRCPQASRPADGVTDTDHSVRIAADQFDLIGHALVLPISRTSDPSVSAGYRLGRSSKDWVTMAEAADQFRQRTYVEARGVGPLWCRPGRVPGLMAVAEQARDGVAVRSVGV
jgi:hypothetical protein